MSHAFKTRTYSTSGQVLRDPLWRLDRGSTTVMAIGLVAAVTVVVSSLGFAFTASTGIVKTQLVADLAALSAADTLKGTIAGYPCENAQSVAEKNGASLTTCRIVRLVAEVSTTTSLGPFQVSRWAEAG